MSELFSTFIKGLAMGAANVIPGVSGGTVALVTGIYERLINALKSCNLSALKLLLARDFSAFFKHIDGRFLFALLAGVGVSVFSLAKLFKYLLADHEVPTMAFFFGLILLSVWYVGRTVSKWGLGAVVALLIGIGIAVGIALLVPASENSAPFYVFLCGVVAICSMILPGLSGSFVLIMMGNYALVLGAVSSLNLSVLVPMALGCAIGLVAFSQLLGWVLKRYHDQTIALMTGFVAGSLVVIWPFKDKITAIIERTGKPAKEIVTGYDWYLPELAQSQAWVAIALVLVGMLTIWLMEKLAANR
jgi:putative membrane protein